MSLKSHETQALPKKLIRALEMRGILSCDEQKDIALEIIAQIYQDREITRLFVTGIRRRDRSDLVNTAELTRPERYAFNRYRKSLLEEKRISVANVTDEILTYIIRRQESHQDFNRLFKTSYRLKLIDMVYTMRKKAYNEIAKLKKYAHAL